MLYLILLFDKKNVKLNSLNVRSCQNDNYKYFYKVNSKNNDTMELHNYNIESGNVLRVKYTGEPL